MSKIIIAVPSYDSSVGGSIVLHKLCDMLLTLGYDAYLQPTEKLNSSLDVFWVNEEYKYQITNSIDAENDIAIYPEIQPGNPFGTKKVIRYILNNYHLPENENVMSTWGENDYWLYFHNYFYDGIKDPNFLHITEPKLDIFKDYKLERKHESCFTYRKKINEKNNLSIIHPSNSIEIKHGINDEDLIIIFNTCKRFYSYDTETYLSILASLCGCESVIVPYKDIPKEKIIVSDTAFEYGIAYGLDDLERANSTRDLLKEFIIKDQLNQLNKIDIEFKKIFEYFNIK
jgi:hypothetical protein